MFRHLRESLRSLIRNGWMTFASVSAVTVTLLILGVSLVIAMNASQVSNTVQSQLEVSAYLKMSVTDQQAAGVAAQVRRLAGVKSVQLVTKEQGMKSLQSELNQYSGILAGLKPSTTLPDKLVIKAANPRQTLTVGKEVGALPEVAQVRDDQQAVKRLFRILDTIRNIGLVFVVALVVTAMFLISNTIKITIINRQREIEIMKLVGATNWFIRWPFLLESLIIGVVGALIPFAVIVSAYHSVYARSGGVFAVLMFHLVSTPSLAARLAEVLFGIGILIGLWGGLMSIRRFLKV